MVNLYYLFAFLLLVLGILNPAGGSRIDSLIGFFVVGLVSVSVFKNRRVFLLLLALASFVSYAKVKGFDLTIVYGLLLGFGLSFLLEKFKAEKFRVLVLVMAFLTSSVVTSSNLRATLTRDLPLYTYNNDEGAFLKTYKMMKGGVPYYDAYRVAFMGKFANHTVPGDVWGWRMPTIFEMWKIIPGSGIGIYILYLALSSGMIYASYLVGKRYLGSTLALLPAYLVFPYLHFAARDEIVLLTEWWSVAFFFLGLYLFVARKYFLAILFLALTVLIREIYIMPLGLMFLYFALKLKREAVVFLIPLVAFLVLLFYHVLSLGSYIDAWHSLFSARIVSSGIFFVEQTLSFGSWEYLLFGARPFVLFLVLALSGCWYMYRAGRKDEAWIWALAFLPFPVAFMKFGAVPYNDYWGIMYMPIVLILAPIALGNFQGRGKQL
jgi:hypothetical protein